MIKNKKGFRTESFSGSGVRDPMEVIEFEIKELCNTDIVEFVQEEYGLLTHLDVENQIELIDICHENIKEILETIKNYVLDYFKVDSIEELEAVWLAEYERVKSFYNDEEEDGIYEVSLNRRFLVLSDLDIDGALFVFKYE